MKKSILAILEDDLLLEFIYLCEELFPNREFSDEELESLFDCAKELDWKLSEEYPNSKIRKYFAKENVVFLKKYPECLL